MYEGRRRPFAAAALLIALVTMVSCTNAPPPPLVSREPGKPTTTAPTTQPQPTEVVVGVDQIEGGFNPHTLADLSPTSLALASLMLPSVFRPVADGSLQLDTTLMESAEVVPGTAKFTVRYKIRKEAGWSDGAPIAAEDFVYLWEQLRSRPGVADAAGYQLIDNVTSRQGGKTVEVSFAQPYPGWKTLFSNLLPAHLLRDAPSRWSTALDSGYPASGGPFWIRQLDRARGEITLERNDRYWGSPAKADRIVLRASDKAGQVEALRSGDSHLAVFSADAATMAQLRDLGPDVRLSEIPLPATMQVLLRPDSQQLADVRVRKAVEAALDRQALIDVGTGGGPASRFPARTLTLAPSEPGYQPTEPVNSGFGKPDPARVAQLLTEAGYVHSGGVWTRDGRPLSLVIAAPFEHQQYIQIAQAAAQQLSQQGIQATVVTPTSDQLFDTVLTANPRSPESQTPTAVDMAIAPRSAGGDPASMLADSYGCARTTPEGGNPLPFNDTGFCDELLQPTIEAALRGRPSFAEVGPAVERVLWDQTIALPLYQQAQVLAVRGNVGGVQPGYGFAGPFSTAAGWIGTPAKSGTGY